MRQKSLKFSDEAVSFVVPFTSGKFSICELPGSKIFVNSKSILSEIYEISDPLMNQVIGLKPSQYIETISLCTKVVNTSVAMIILMMRKKIYAL